jgi:diguanylate cyclase (GGDEF)-like protein
MKRRANSEPTEGSGHQADSVRTLARDPEDSQRPTPFSAATIMLVDDEPTTLEVLEMLLQAGGFENIISTGDSREALGLVQRHRPDALLVDVMMPHVGGLEILEAIRSDPTIRHTPVITLTSSTEAETKLQALELGATDFLAKPVDPSELALRLRNTLAAKAYQDRLTYYDELTDLPNRRLFLDHLNRMLLRATAQSTECVLMNLDIDRFQQINDAMGHGIGDELLKGIADRLRGLLRPTDLLASTEEGDEDKPLSRIGGDEFSILLHGVGAADRAARIARRMRTVLSKPFYVGGRDLFVTCSVGIGLFPTDGQDAETLLSNVNFALADAKRRGGNDFRFYERSLNLESAERFSLENHLRHALDRKELKLQYQPKIDVLNGEVTGVEALMRWHQPELGLVGPDQFIPIAEETNLIGALGEWALRTGCQQAMKWEQAGLPPLSMSINVSALQFQGGQIVGAVRQALDDSGLDPSHLILELTESVLIDSPAETAAMLDAIKEMGVRISVDDFGTGYSSLSYLKRFPIDELKIDRSFVHGVADDEDDAAIVTAIIRMGHALGLTVVAEGVETEEQLAFLSDRGCNTFQGFLRSKPLPPSELAAMLASLA